MRKMPGPEASATATKMLSVLGLTRMSLNGSALKTKVANSHPPASKVSASLSASAPGPGAIAGDEQHAEQHDRKGEEDRRQRIGDWRLQNARRHQEVEEDDDREGQHQIGQERQRRVDAAAEIASRQAEHDAGREREQRRQRRDDEHDAGAGDDPAEHVARQLVAAEQVGQAGVRIDRARRRMLQFRDLAERIEELDLIGENRREQPEADEKEPGESDAARNDMTVEPEPLAKDQARAEGEREARPDGNELHEGLENDLAGAQELQARPINARGCAD